MLIYVCVCVCDCVFACLCMQAGDWRHRGPYNLKENESYLLGRDGWAPPLSLPGSVWKGPEGGAAYSMHVSSSSYDMEAGGGAAYTMHSGRLIPGAGTAGTAAAANQKQTEKERQLCADFASRGGAVWVCTTCTLHNEDMHLVCDACGSHKLL
jgi:hypothetical protein